jgi:hypothetical protein
MVAGKRLFNATRLAACSFAPKVKQYAGGIVIRATAAIDRRFIPSGTSIPGSTEASLLCRQLRLTDIYLRRPNKPLGRPGRCLISSRFDRGDGGSRANLRASFASDEVSSNVPFFHIQRGRTVTIALLLMSCATTKYLSSA